MALRDRIYDACCRNQYYSEIHGGSKLEWTVNDISRAMHASYSGAYWALRSFGECFTWRTHYFGTQGGVVKEYLISLTDWRV